MTGQSGDYSTLSGPSSTLISSTETRTAEQVRRAQLNAADHVKTLGLPPGEEKAALREILQVLGLLSS
jgi:tellurite resistance protein